MQFIIYAYDATDDKALERRMAVRPDHLENIKKVKEKGSVICAGGLTNDDGKVIGSFLVMEFANKELFNEYLESEPYIKHGVWDEVKINNCNVVITNDEKVGK